CRVTHAEVALMVSGTGELSKAFLRQAAAGNDMSKRILVVEDQPDNRQIIRDMLSPTDYEITEAENGEEALAAIAKQRPDLILMDIQLPYGYSAADYGRLYSDESDQSRSGAAIDPDHRGHLLCAQRRRKEGTGGRLR